MNEGEIKKEIKNWLESEGVYVHSISTTGIPDGMGGYRKNPNCGISDLVGVLPDGKAIYIEVKTPESKTKRDRLKNQIMCLERVNINKGISFFAHSLEEAQDKLYPILKEIDPVLIREAKLWAQTLINRMRSLGY